MLRIRNVNREYLLVHPRVAVSSKPYVCPFPIFSSKQRRSLPSHGPTMRGSESCSIADVRFFSS